MLRPEPGVRYWKSIESLCLLEGEACFYTIMIVIIRSSRRGKRRGGGIEREMMMMMSMAFLGEWDELVR